MAGPVGIRSALTPTSTSDARSAPSELSHDWVMTHEMVHVAFPNTGDDHPWIQEGVATYVEPLARSFVKTNSTRAVWGDLVEGLPKGMLRRQRPGSRSIQLVGANLLGRGSLLRAGRRAHNPA